MAHAIKDTKTGQYYRQRLGSGGWYSTDINAARLFSTAKQAQLTIDADGHHVTWPGDRELKIVEIALTEV